MNYSTEYDTYWSRDDRIGESSGDLQKTADEILLTCGRGAILDVGSGEGALVRALLDRGVDALGVDVSEVVVARCNLRVPGRYVCGSVLALPFDAEAFDTVVSTDCMEHLSSDDIPTALREIHRVARRNVFLQLATTQDRDDHWHLTVEGRSWWEARCFEAGFRKHPAYYKVNGYESLNDVGWQISILLEKLPSVAAEDYPLTSLNEERGLHMDMLRDGGERSDAHVIRYHWACDYIRPGDRVLDAACGLGYGGRVIRHNTRSAKIVGIDGSEYAVDYATKSFADPAGTVEYQLGMLPEALAAFEDGSFDAIVSFETLEHVENPEALLREFRRLLTPGGRLLVSVPNDWSDETGEDPNPYHLHVYGWRRLKSELSASLTLEAAYAQTASQCKVSGGEWQRRDRSLRKVAITEDAPMDCEWWLMVAMKSPVATSDEYVERVFFNIANAAHPSIKYTEYFENPWLMHSMVNVSYRLKNVEALNSLAKEVLANSPKASNDYLAALCVVAYRSLEQQSAGIAGIVAEIIPLVDEAVARVPVDAMGFRWKVSLLFVKGRLLQSMGDLTNAKNAFMDCATQNVREFGVHLATKTTEACFIAGTIAYSLGDSNDARICWQRSFEIGTQLLAMSVDDILINRKHPNLFNFGDGAREYATAWDNIARCANGLNLLAEGGEVDERLLQGSFQSEYSIVTRDVIASREQVNGVTLQLMEERRALAERTGFLEQSNEALKDRTLQLVDVRLALQHRTTLLEQCSAELAARTILLEHANAQLAELTQELVEVRETALERTRRLESITIDLGERTRLLERANTQLEDLTQELVAARKVVLERTARLERSAAELVERTELLERANKELEIATREAVEVRGLVVERTDRLALANSQLEDTTKELVEVRGVALDRTKQLERCNTDLVERTNLLVRGNERIKSLSQELADLREVVVERTALLDHASVALVDRTTQLDRANEGLEAFSLDVTKWREAVNERTDLLEQLTAQFEERGHMLADANRELEANKMNLAEAREEIESKARLLELANSEIARLSRSLLNRLWSQVQGR